MFFSPSHSRSVCMRKLGANCFNVGQRSWSKASRIGWKERRNSTHTMSRPSFLLSAFLVAQKYNKMYKKRNYDRLQTKLQVDSRRKCSDESIPPRQSTSWMEFSARFWLCVSIESFSMTFPEKKAEKHSAWVSKQRRENGPPRYPKTCNAINRREHARINLIRWKLGRRASVCDWNREKREKSFLKATNSSRTTKWAAECSKETLERLNCVRREARIGSFIVVRDSNQQSRDMWGEPRDDLAVDSVGWSELELDTVESSAQLKFLSANR